MLLKAGFKLGRYEIVEPLGKGGMGEVYRALDSQLDREVAIKVLPEELTEDAEYRRRFQREAKVVSQISHPNICTLHDVGQDDGRDFLVMELLDGETLAERLRRGALPFDEVVTLGGQIAEAIESAHRMGVAHRDLKPGNVMLTSSGAKVLDFGLAKQLDPAPISVDTAAPTEAHHAESSEPLTAEGAVIGTMQYMAPEQVEGKAVDARSDLFALGVVLYEMATGQSPFAGDSQAALTASILAETPRPLSAFDLSLPTRFVWVVERCLEKDPEKRWQSARDVALGLGSVSADRASIELMEKRTAPRAFAGALIGALGLIVGVAVGAVLLGDRSVEVTASTATEWTTSSLDLEPGLTSLALSPDGRRLIYGTSFAPALYSLRDLQSSRTTPVPGTEGAAAVEFSAGDELVVGTGTLVRRVSLADGLVIETINGALGALGEDDGFLYITTFDPSFDEGRTKAGTAAFRQWRRPIDGEEMQSLGEGILWRGGAVPGGRQRFAWGHDSGGPRIHLLDLETGTRTDLMRGAMPFYLAPGFLGYFWGGRIFAVPLDDDNLPIGTPREIEPGVATAANAVFGVFTVSSSGDLVYRRSRSSAPRRLVWADREGNTLGAASLETGSFNSPKISPDGGEVSLSAQDGFRSYQPRRLDLETGAWTQSVQPGSQNSGVWWAGPEGSEWLFISNREGARSQIFAEPADGSQPAQALLSEEVSEILLDVSPDGRHVLWESPANFGVSMLDRETKVSQRLTTEEETMSAVFHPSGDWFAYADQGDEPGIWIHSTNDDRAIRLTEGNHREVLWSPDGSELYFRSTTHVMSLPISLRGERVEAGRPQQLFEDRFEHHVANGYTNWAVHPDGRFLFLEAVGQTTEDKYVYIQNWTAKVAALFSSEAAGG